MEIRLILLAILAHIFGDFVLQGKIITSMRFPNKLINKTNDLVTIKLTSKKNIISATKFLEKIASIHTPNKKHDLNSSNKDLDTSIKQSFCFPLKVSYIIKHTFKGNMIHSLIQGCIFILFIYINNYLGNILLPNKIFIKMNIAMNSINSLYVVGYFVLMHYIVDQMKVVFAFRNPRLYKNIYYFLLDQILHLLSFILIPCIYLGQISLVPKVITQSLSNPIISILNEKLLVILIVFLTTTAFAGIFIKTVIEYIDEKQLNNGELIGEKDISMQTPNTEIRRGGYTIGILERILIISSILISHPQLIGYILTAKSIARLKKLNEDKFAEYFLIGNALSFIFAIAGGAIINFIIKN